MRSPQGSSATALVLGSAALFILGGLGVVYYQTGGDSWLFGQANPWLLRAVVVVLLAEIGVLFLGMRIAHLIAVDAQYPTSTSGDTHRAGPPTQPLPIPPAGL